MSKREFPPSECLYPVPVVLVSCIDKTGQKANIITIAWCGIVCSAPPHLSVSLRPSRFSHELIKETGDFVVNIPTKELLKKVDLCGNCSGRDIDKFKTCSFTKVPSSKVHSPAIKECPVNIECRLKEIIKLGAHDVFIGEVLAIHIDEGILNVAGKIDYDKAKPFVYNQGGYWDLGEQIGYYGCSKE